MAETNAFAKGQSLPPGGLRISVAAQYIKDFSFENPNAPDSFVSPPKNPGLEIQVNVNARHREDSQFEVELALEGTAEEERGVLFKFELKYAGLFLVEADPSINLEAVLLIECPKLLFPFARHIIAEQVKHGAYPPLYLEVIDFAKLYQDRLNERNAEKGANNASDRIKSQTPLN